ncbi:MAG: hypothetical protein M1565_06995 [Actinobacteria bacterium]|nr:hypothetical protein [Actinomycetota bacterium]
MSPDGRFAYLFEGAGTFGAQATPVTAEGGTLVLFGDGDSVSISSAEEGTRFWLVLDKPLHEPIAWRGLEEAS